MKKLIILFCCLFFLFNITVQRTFAKSFEILEVKTLEGSLVSGVQIQVVAEVPFFSGAGQEVAEDGGYKPCINKINGVLSTNCYYDESQYAPDRVSGKKLSSTTKEILYIIRIPTTDLAQYGITKLGVYPIVINYTDGKNVKPFEGSFEILPEPEVVAPVIETGPSSETCIHCIDQCCIEKAETSFVKGLCSADNEALCRQESCFDSCTEATANVGDNKPIISADTSNIELLSEDLSNVQDDIISEFEDSNIRVLRSIATKIDRIIKSLDGAVENADSDDPDACNDDLQKSEKNLDRVISRLESKSCATKETKRCIPEDIADGFISDLQDILDELDSEISIDENEDGIADACGSI